MFHLVLKDVRMQSTPEAAGLAVTSIYFPPSTARCTGLTPGMLVLLFLALFNWVSPWSTSRKTTGWCIIKPFGSNQKLCVPLDSCQLSEEWAGHGWHPRVMAGSGESGEPVCLPLLSQSALFVTRYHRLSRHRAPWPHMHLSVLAMMALLSRSCSAPQRENMSSSSSHMVLKRPCSSWGSSTLPLPIDRLNPRLHSSTYLSVFLSLRLAICLPSLPLVCVLV